jgi:mono/diheme cytochrome c family protein
MKVFLEDEAYEGLAAIRLFWWYYKFNLLTYHQTKSEQLKFLSTTKAAANLKAFILVVGFLSARSEATEQEALVARGDYLVNSIVACGNCHTPRGADHKPIIEMHLAGAFQVDRAEFTAYAPNITPDRETGIGAWSDTEIIRVIREGVRPDGTIIGPPMPIRVYREMSDTDVRSIVAYLRTVAPVKNSLPRSKYNIPLPESYGPPVDTVPDVPREDTVAYGAYVANALGHCMECHTPLVKGAPDLSRIGAGGNVFVKPHGMELVAVAANISPHPEQGIGTWTDEEIKRAITQATSRDGRPLQPAMPFYFYKKISDEDLEAVIAYLRSIPPQAIE